MPDVSFAMLTMDAVAEILCCSKAHVSHLLSGRVKGCARLPSCRLGRRLLVRRETLEEWLRAHESSTLGVSPERGTGKRA